METQDPVLAALAAEFESKSAEANRIIADPAATGPALVKAEALAAELEKLQGRIDERREEFARKQAIAGRLAAGRGRMDQPNRTMPFSGAAGGPDGAGQFRYSGSEPAGSTTLAFDPRRKQWEMIAEAGAGLLNQEKRAIWELLGSFEYKRDFLLYLRKGNRQIDLCQKTLMEGMDDQGGVFAPAELIARIIGRLPAPTHLRSLVTTVTTGRDTLIMPRKQYSDAGDQFTTAFRVNWTGEVPADGTGQQTQVNDANLLGNVEIPVHTAMLSAPVTRNLVEDSAFPIQAWLESELAQAVDLEYENQILNGSGVGQPTGIYFGAASGNAEGNQFPEVILSSTAGGIDYGLTVGMQTALAPQYEQSDSLRWVCNKRSTLAALMKLVDSQNRPLFTTGYEDSGMVGGRERRLLGDPITLSNFAQSVSSTTFPLIYGDLKGYYVAQRVGFSIQVLDQTRAKANQIELVGRVRFGGRPIEPWRIKLGKSNNA
jgi:HK97 family phage major capsid protein